MENCQFRTSYSEKGVSLLQLWQREIKVVAAKYHARIGIFKDEPICRLCNNEEEADYHLVFEFTIAGLSERDLPHWLLNLVKAVYGNKFSWISVV